MKIVHRVSFIADDELKSDLDTRGIKYESLRKDLILLLIDEEDKGWSFVASIINKHQGLDLPTTKFTKNELANATHLVIQPSWHHGYPQPEKDFAYKRVTY